MNYVLPISEARSKLPELVDLADSIFRKTYITVKGRVKAAIVPAEHLDLMEETIEVLSDPITMKKIARGKKQIKKGELISWQSLKDELGL